LSFQYNTAVLSFIISIFFVHLKTTIATVGDLRRSIYELYPAISARKIIMGVAVNAKVANDKSVLNNFDEIALLPPISGG
jgi:sulfur-carrier protein